MAGQSGDGSGRLGIRPAPLDAVFAPEHQRRTIVPKSQKVFCEI